MSRTRNASLEESAPDYNLQWSMTNLYFADSGTFGRTTAQAQQPYCDLDAVSKYTELNLEQMVHTGPVRPRFSDLMKIYHGQNALLRGSLLLTGSSAPDTIYESFRSWHRVVLGRSHRSVNSSAVKSGALDDSYKATRRFYAAVPSNLVEPHTHVFALINNVSTSKSLFSGPSGKHIEIFCTLQVLPPTSLFVRCGCLCSTLRAHTHANSSYLSPNSLSGMFE
jgi:hypothetical protein